MTDPTEHPSPAVDPDELASAYVDGELSAEQRAAVGADPALMALVERHARVRDVLARPVEPLPAHEREALLATALAAAAGGAAGAADTAAAAGPGPDVAPVVPIERARSTRRVRWLAAGLAAAAAVAVVALVVTRPGGGDGGGVATQQDTGSASALTEAAAAKAATAAPPAEAAGGASATTAGAGSQAADAASSPSTLAAAAVPAPAAGATTSGAPGPTMILGGSALPDLGPLADRPAFIAAARPYATVASPPGTGPCAGYPPPLAAATFQGTPAYLVVIAPSATGNRVALVATGSCAVLVKADLSEG